MSTNAELKQMVGKLVQIVDDWDLVHGLDPLHQQDDVRELIGLLINGSIAADMDPNKLASLQDFLQDGKFAITVKK